MKHSLQLKLSQHLTLTPQLQQSIRLLQLSTLELNQELERFLQENPLLEREEEDGEEGPPPATPTAEAAPEPPPDLPSEIPSDIPSEVSTSSTSEGDGDEVPDAPEAAESTERESMDDADWLDEGSYGNSGSPEGEESDYPQMPAGTTSLREHLLWQVNLMNLPHRDKQMAAIIVDSLDDNGYMKQDLAELAEMLPAEIEADEEDLLIALRHVQNLDPPGVAARDLGECLALQLAALPQDTPWRTEALN
ncbi:MAG: RNA polymerase factor sigma-54, partial [Thermoanaerobaculia bacterium]|nr:RNA polymerase factor sigma-54 [Thermoanaerobaculia bacterium]